MMPELASGESAYVVVVGSVDMVAPAGSANNDAGGFAVKLFSSNAVPLLATWT
jgi:hypothetical protein